MILTVFVIILFPFHSEAGLGIFSEEKKSDNIFEKKEKSFSDFSSDSSNDSKSSDSFGLFENKDDSKKIENDELDLYASSVGDGEFELGGVERVTPIGNEIYILMLMGVVYGGYHVLKHIYPSKRKMHKKTVSIADRSV